MERGGWRPGSGRKKKTIEQKLIEIVPPGLEKAVAQILKNGEVNDTADLKKLAHKVAYMEQELEFIKKIILAENGKKPKC